MSVLVHGLGIAGYRSFYGDLQLLGPLDRVNLLAGQNNVGKSNVLRWIKRILTEHPQPLSGHDLPQSGGDGGAELAVGRKLLYEELQEVVGRHNLSNGFAQRLREVFELPAFRLTNDDLVWFRFDVDNRGGELQFSRSLKQTNEAVNTLHGGANDLQTLSMALASQSSGDPVVNLQTILQLFPGNLFNGDLDAARRTRNPLGQLPRIETVSAFRQLRPSTVERPQDEIDLTGDGLIDVLGKLQNPLASRRDDRQIFGAVNRFLQSVLEDDEAYLDIPRDMSTVNVERRGTYLPLENLGDGVHQVIILATAAILFNDTLLCIEEPEIHLHPLLQRKFVRYLCESTNNQYLITTHSATMLDHERCTISHVQNSDGPTTITHVSSPVELSRVCHDLGYRPSDLLQTNAVVWVEGPSDRIYVRHWLAMFAPGLVEGIHFSIMFYGGRLLNHLSAIDPDVDDFISLCRLNRHVVVMMDSDKKSPSSRINSTKRRISSEIDQLGPAGYAWTTHGRTIENYVPRRVLAEAVGKASPRSVLLYNGGKWEDVLPSNSQPRLDKVHVAREVVGLWDRAEVEQDRSLARSIKRTVSLIEDANGT